MLTALFILLLLLIGVLLVLLFLPIRLMVDTTRELYHMQWGPAHAGVILGEDGIRYRMHLPFWTKEGDLGDLFRTEVRLTQPKPPTPARSMSWRPSIRSLLRTFHVQRFRWVLDTDDPLFSPVFDSRHQASEAVTGASRLPSSIHRPRIHPHLQQLL